MEKGTIIIRNFYKNLMFYGFKTINEERKRYLDELVNIFASVLRKHTVKDTMIAIILWLTYNSQEYGLLNGDEQAYFLINIVDPNLLFLEAHEVANTKDDEKLLCIKYFNIYDPILIKLERKYNTYFNIYDLDEIWSFNRL